MSTLITSNNTVLTYDGTSFIANSVTLSSPLSIINSSSLPVIITLDFIGTIASSNDYIIIGSNDIIIDGANKLINVSTPNFTGLIHNTSYSNITVKNIIITPVGMGLLATSAGWICCSNTINTTVTNCHSTGNISTNAGGIFGASSTNCIANNCHSSGTIDTNSGGIFGSAALNSTANNCFSSGNISNSSGGIFGAGTNASSVGLLSSANKCHSMGLIGTGPGDYNNGGIFGPVSNISAVNSVCAANFCASFGNIFGDVNGSNSGIFALSFETSCTATNCYSVGNIGDNCGGIFTAGSGGVATYCYAIGTMGASAGGIFSSNCSNCSAVSCYSVGDIGVSGGGIIGENCSSCAVTTSYSIGAVAAFAGGIIGGNSNATNIIDCYTLTNLIGINPINNTTVNSISENGGSWNDNNALLTIAATNTVWTALSNNTPFLLTKFQNYNNISSSGFRYSFVFPSTNIVTSNSSYDYVTTNITSNSTFVNIFIYGSTNVELINPSIIPTNLYGYNIVLQSIVVNVPGTSQCLLEGTKILTDNGYISIENLKIGDMIKTVGDGFKKLTLLGHRKMFNDPTKTNSIYRYRKHKIPTLVNDLYITGYHSVLVKDRKSAAVHLIHKIDNYYKLLVHLDKRAVKWDHKGEVTVWHLALDDKIYGVYANGMLVETIKTSHLEDSNMVLIS